MNENKTVYKKVMFCASAFDFRINKVFNTPYNEVYGETPLERCTVFYEFSIEKGRVYTFNLGFLKAHVKYLNLNSHLTAKESKYLKKKGVENRCSA